MLRHCNHRLLLHKLPPYSCSPQRDISTTSTLEIRTTTLVYKRRIITSSQKHPLVSNQRRFYTKDGVSKVTKDGVSKATTANQSPNFLQEKAQNAARLHAELNALLEAQAQRQTKELSKPFGSSIKAFVQMNKKEFLNIFVAFMCVLLAWQITVMRKNARQLVDLSDEKESIIQQLRLILRQLNHQDDENFIDKVVDRLAKETKRFDQFSDKPSKGNNTWVEKLLWGSFPRRKDDQEEEYMKRLLKSILKEELDKLIGTAAMSRDELVEKKISDLKREMNVTSSDSTTERDLVHLLDTVNREDEDSSDESRHVVKTRKGFI